MKYFKYILLLYILPQSFQNIIEDEAILNYVRGLSHKHFIHVFVCWNMARKMAFVKKFSKNSIMVSMSDMESGYEISPKPAEAHYLMFLIDLRCGNTTGILKRADESLAFGSPFKWIFLAKLEDFPGVNNITINSNLYCNSFMKDMKILTDSDVSVLRENTDGSFLQPIIVYKRKIEDDLIFENYTQISAAVRRQNIEGSLIRICYVITDNDTVNHLSDYKHKEIDTITKVNYILTNHIVDFTNGSRAFSFVSSWGYRNVTDNSWSGMIGKLSRLEADIGGSPLFFTSDRVSVIDFIAMPTPTKSKFVFRQPKLSYMSNVFVLPFRAGVWLSSFGLIFVLMIFLLISSKWETSKYISIFKTRIEPDTLHPTISDVFITTIGAICQQGSYLQLKSVVGRIVILLLFLSFMFLYTSYSANIVALLQSSSSRIKTLSDLLNSRIKFGVHDTVFNRYYFSTATEPIRRAIYQKKILVPGSEPNFMALEEGVKRLQAGLFAFHMETGVGYKIVSEIFHEGEKCGLQEIQYLQVIDPWLAIQKNSSFKEIFKIGFRRLQEHGLQSRENSLFYTKKPKCAGTGTNFISVGMIDCEPAILILAYGYIVAIGVLILEKLIYHRLEMIKIKCINLKNN